MLGNIDSKKRVEQVLEGTRIRLLVNSTIRIKVKDRRLTIGGLDWQYYSAPARGIIDHLEADGDGGDIRILGSSVFLVPAVTEAS